MNKNKGFTLVELIIVIAILAIIMLIAIPNFSGIQQRMQVRADKATAAQIGKAVRVWFTDYTTDSGLAAGAAADEFLPKETKIKIGGTETTIEGLPVAGTGVTPVKYAKLAGLEEYISLDEEPSSLKNASKETVEDQHYGIGLSAAASSSAVKVVVTIGVGNASDSTLTAPADWENVTYDGSAAAVAYIEP